jgi:hypothetical protein
MIEAGAAEELPQMSAAVWRFLERSQILSTETARSSPACEYEVRKRISFAGFYTKSEHFAKTGSGQT